MVNAGVLAVLNDDVHFARETTKTITTLLQTFHSPNRSLAGFVLIGRARFYFPPALKRSMRASLSASFQLPSVFRMAADILCGNAQTICHAGATERA
jgi:L-asparaginase/Glu-tRNA(Gln) amidotransferase subunit D